jgi:hypothetical protein
MSTEIKIADATAHKLEDGIVVLINGDPKDVQIIEDNRKSTEVKNASS